MCTSVRKSPPWSHMQKYEMAFLKATKMLKEIDVYLYAGKDFTKFIFSVFLLDFSVVHQYLI